MTFQKLCSEHAHVRVDHRTDQKNIVKSYFLWTSPPRVDYIGIYDYGFLDDEPVKRRIQPDNHTHITFLKMMLTVERIAEGPIYVGEDVGNFKTPGEAASCGELYELPLELDYFIPTWRYVDSIELEESTTTPFGGGLNDAPEKCLLPTWVY